MNLITYKALGSLLKGPMSFQLNSTSNASLGLTEDIEPAGLNLSNLSYTDGNAVPNNVAQVAGISASINIRLVLTGGSGGTVYYRSSSSSFTSTDYSTNAGAWTALSFTGSNSASINVAPNRYIGFAVVPTTNGNTNTYQVQNVSGGNAVIGSFTALKSAAAGGDVVPNALNWSDINYLSSIELWGFTQRQITGISQTITLRISLSNTSQTIYYHKGASGFQGQDFETDFSDAASPSGQGMTQIGHNGTFTVSNNDYVCFASESGASFTVTVVNVSNSNSTLDTFNYTFVP